MRDTSETYYAQHYAEMRVVADKVDAIKKAARLVLAQKDALYLPASARTGVPWVMFGLAHYREGSCNPKRQIFNGEMWDRITTLVPKGQGPWPDWISAAIDAAERHVWLDKDWSIGLILQRLERYNGLGYAHKDMDSPYVWSMTHWHRKGKYVRDHVYDPEAEDKQCGVAPVLKSIMDAGAFTL